MSFTVGSQIPADDVTELDHFLSARWALVTQRRSRLLYGRVNHPRWPLHHVHDVTVRQDVLESAGLPSPHGPPHAFYSPGVDVEVAWFSDVRAAGGSTERAS